VLLAVLIAAFSLRPVPEPLQSELGGETFDGPTAVRQLDGLAQRYAHRRAGSSGDRLLGLRIREELARALPAATVALDHFRGDTPDGGRDLLNVTATLPGAPGPGIAIVAHRDALEPGSKAELSGTAALLALARAAANTRFHHSIRFVSTTGGSGGGLVGATRVARQLRGQVEAVVVLGDLSGPRDRAPRVIGWSNRGPTASLRLEKTVIQALRQERLGAVPRSDAAFWPQLARRGLPATPGEQGEVNQAGIPAVLLTSGSPVPPAADAEVDGPRFAAYGRAVMRTLSALDASRAGPGRQQDGIELLGKVLPQWALRLVLLTVLLPLLVLATVVVLSLHRDGHRLVAGAAWGAGCVAGPLVTGLLAVGLGRIGLVWPAVPAPYAGPAIDPGVGAWLLVVVLAGLLVATTALARPRLAREAGGEAAAAEPTPITVAVAVFGGLAAVALVLVVLNPVTALLVLPALLAWPAALAPLPILGALHRVALVGVGAALPLAAAITVAADLDVSLGQVPWWLVLLVAGGQVTPVGMLLVSVVVGALVATLLMLAPRRSRRGPARRGEDRPPRARADRRARRRAVEDDLADAIAEER